MSDTLIFNDAKAKKFFDKLQGNEKDIRTKDLAYWGGITSIAFKDVIDHFRKEAGPTKKWQKWSKLYTDRKIKRDRGGDKILQDSGRLRQSVNIARSSVRRRKGQLLFNQAKTKTGFPYAQAHNEGSGKLPQREYMWLSLKALNKISKITSAYLVKGV